MSASKYKDNSIKDFFTKNSDKTLFLKLKKYKDKQAFVAVYDQYLTPIYRFVYFKVNDMAEAEDLTSQVFLKCWSYIQDGKITDYGTIRAFLYKVARNTVIDYYRQKTENQPLDEAENVASPEQLPPETIDNNLSVALIVSQIKKLKDEYREVLILKFVNELSTTEIAEILGKTRGNIRVLLHRAERALKKLVTEEENKSLVVSR